MPKTVTILSEQNVLNKEKVSRGKLLPATCRVMNLTKVHLTISQIQDGVKTWSRKAIFVGHAQV